MRQQSWLLMTVGLSFSFFCSRSEWVTVMRFYTTETLYKGEYEKRRASKPTSHLCLLLFQLIVFLLITVRIWEMREKRGIIHAQMLVLHSSNRFCEEIRYLVFSSLTSSTHIYITAGEQVSQRRKRQKEKKKRRQNWFSSWSLK